MSPWDLTTCSPLSRHQPGHVWVSDPAISKVKHFTGFDSTIFLFPVTTSFSVISPSGTKKLGKPSLHTTELRGAVDYRAEVLKIHLWILQKSNPSDHVSTQGAPLAQDWPLSLC